MDDSADEKSGHGADSALVFQLFLVYVRIGATSFGGGVSGWMHSEIVQRRGWLSEDKFFASLTFAQVLPGPGPVNIAIYIGLQIAGWAGAVAATIGMILPSFCIILCLGLLYDRFGSIAAVQIVLGGLAAVGIGVTASMGLRRLVYLRRDVLALLFVAVVIVLVGILRWSIPSVIVLVLPPSLLVAYLQERWRPDE